MEGCGQWLPPDTRLGQALKRRPTPRPGPHGSRASGGCQVDMRIGTSYFATGVRLPGMSPAGIAFSTSSPFDSRPRSRRTRSYRLLRVRVVQCPYLRSPGEGTGATARAAREARRGKGQSSRAVDARPVPAKSPNRESRRIVGWSDPTTTPRFHVVGPANSGYARPVSVPPSKAPRPVLGCPNGEGRLC